MSELLEEYKFLRAELEAIWSQSYTTINFILALVGFIVSSAYSGYSSSFTQNSSGADGHRHFILLMASLVTGGGYWLVYVHTTRVWRIVGYMRVRLEPKMQIKWETALAKRLGTVSAVNRDSTIFGGHLAVLGFVNLALGVGMAVDLLAHPKCWEWLEIGVPAILALYPVLKDKALRRGGDLEDVQHEAWKEFDRVESGGAGPSN